MTQTERDDCWRHNRNTQPLIYTQTGEREKMIAIHSTTKSFPLFLSSTTTFTSASQICISFLCFLRYYLFMPLTLNCSRKKYENEAKWDKMTLLMTIVTHLNWDFLSRGETIEREEESWRFPFKDRDKGICPLVLPAPCLLDHYDHYDHHSGWRVDRRTEQLSGKSEVGD